MQRFGQSTIIALGALLSWLALGQLIFVEDAGSHLAFDPWRLLLYVLLLAAPALTFIPLARWADAPFFEIEATLGWASFGLILAVVQPSSPPTLVQFLLFLIPLTVALASLTTLASYLIGLRVYRGDPRRFDVVRARRQGYLAALSLVACMLLFSVGTFSPTSAMLILIVATLTEMFALNRDGHRFLSDA